MPFSVTIIPRDDSATNDLVESPYGDIFSVFESLTIPFHQLCMTALDTVSVRTTPACRRIVHSICSSRLSGKGAPRGKERPGILCPPPPEGENQPGPWFYLMGTFDGHDESSLPEVYREFAVIVATGPPKDSDEDKFCIRTVPEWHTSSPEKTQWVIPLPLTTGTGIIPSGRWMYFGNPSVPYSMDFEEFEKLDDFSRERVTAFFQKLFYDRNYLKNVAQALRDDEVKVCSCICFSRSLIESLHVGDSIAARSKNIMQLVGGQPRPMFNSLKQE